MKTDITDLLSIENLTEERQVQTDLEVFQSKSGKFPIMKKEPFMIHLENQENKQLLISGETDVTLKIPCDRCLKDVAVGIHLVIDRIYPLQKAESEKDGNAEDADYMTGTVLDIDNLVCQEILINRPVKVLCSESCKGICRKCGVNLNDEICSCGRTEPDPRMAAIWDVFHQFKEV